MTDDECLQFAEQRIVTASVVGHLLGMYHDLQRAHARLFDMHEVAGTYGPWSHDWVGSYEEKHWGERSMECGGEVE